MSVIKEVRVISLKSRFLRRTLIKINLLLIGFNYKIVPGVLVAKQKERISEMFTRGVSKYVQDLGWKRILGVSGCWFAHEDALRSIVTREGYSLILEDDLVISRNFNNVINNFIHANNIDFDLLVIDPKGTGSKSSKNLGLNCFDVKGVCFPHYWGTHCLLINNSRIPKVLAQLRANVISDIDGFYISNPAIKVPVFFSNETFSVYLGSDVEGARKSYLVNLKAIISLFKYLSKMGRCKAL